MKNKLARLKSARKIRAKIRPGEKHRLSVFKTTIYVILHAIIWFTLMVVFPDITFGKSKLGVID